MNGPHTISGKLHIHFCRHREAIHALDMKVVLIDGQELAQLMIENNLGVGVKEVYEVREIDNDYFMED